MPKIVSVETLKKQENDFITRVVLANLVFVFRTQSRDQPRNSRALHAYVSRACVDGSPLCWAYIKSLPGEGCGFK
jgi:hypothetical protein